MKDTKRTYEAAFSDLPAVRFQAVGDDDLDEILHRGRERGGEADAACREDRAFNREVIHKIIRILKEL